ncbi:penicillin-binding transpeptidase domain-containing protein [Gordonia sp. X0973]|uniref:penicillin-binding transpeptidase domain-containing protein n=1 Tax=Gordonia sp. X0973 TaxID=2742602 RepID=UPI000F537BCB|nr:penicillin-binding transpeptidase domain-containing protein [Gordonia sp. X0973]QKT07069.1 penicillin-binding transpeptidase domain-containing protein [Gordonia sp. X0973]
MISSKAKTRMVAIAVAALVGVSLSACGSAEDSPRKAVDRFLASLSAHDAKGAGAQTTDPTAASKAIADLWDGLEGASLDVTTGKVRLSVDNALADVTYKWQLPGKREWSYTAQVAASRGDAGWSVRWMPTDLHPELGADQRLRFRVIEAPRAEVNEADGSRVMANGTVVGVSFDPKAARAAGAEPAQSVAAAVAALHRFDPKLDTQKILETATASGNPYSLIRLSHQDFDQLRDRLAIPGVVATDQAELLPTNPGFAPALLTQVRKVVGDETVGAPGWRVDIVNPNGLTAGVLTDHSPTPAPAVTLTMSRTVQAAAQRAVNATDRFKIAMVVIQPSTGNILAVAQNGRADADGLIATNGLFPPGSTFKMVTAAAAIRNNIAHPTSIVPCPGEIQIGPRVIPNYDKFALGDIPLLGAFAQSCNTTFAELASRMGPSALANQAAAMGLGATYDIPGLANVSGSVPIAPELVSRSEDGFGQGKVLVSPFGLALVAATVAHGSPPVPKFILGRETKVSGPRPTVDPKIYDELKPMMRAVVTEGTGTVVSGNGPIFAKTGEAEFAGGSHAWFAGYRGDLAFATLIVGGGDSTHAVGVTRDFFNSLPSDYALGPRP